MKIVVTGTRGIPDIMSGVETHCEELFPLIASHGFNVTVIRRSNYVRNDLTEYKGVKLVTLSSPKKKSSEAIIHTFRAINEAKKLRADVLQSIMVCRSLRFVMIRKTSMNLALRKTNISWACVTSYLIRLPVTISHRAERHDRMMMPRY